MADLRIGTAARPLSGRIRVPADKSISHRAVILASLADGEIPIDNWLDSSTTRATLDCLRALGAEIKEDNPGQLLVRGRGMHSLEEPRDVLFCQGSGTTMRLLAGLCAGQTFFSVLDGTPTLKRRPMGRVTEPLREMGSTIMGRSGGNQPPLAITGSSPLRAIDWRLPVASAQAKSAILLAGLFADSPTTVREPSPSRDHTERMLRAFGVELKTKQGIATVCPPTRLTFADSRLKIPGDFSSAAFMIVAALLVPRSRLEIESVGLNPTRTGLVDALKEMGGKVQVKDLKQENGEPVGDVTVDYGAYLRGIDIAGDQVAMMVDEFPIFAVLATQANGESRVKGAAELRVKESDRIAALTEELRKLGAEIKPLEDGFIIHGPTRLRGTMVSAHGDHRLAMSLAVAALISSGETIIEGWECVSDSFPNFEEVILSVMA